MTPPLSPELSQIAKLLDRPRPQVVVVVGTGVAINATGQPHASWLGLLKHGIRHLVAQNRFTQIYGDQLESSLNAAFSPFQLQAALQHAELVEQALNTPNEKAFGQWLDSAFATFKACNDEKAKASLEALRDLEQAGALLLTTNYDSLLCNATILPPVTWEQHEDFHRVTTGQKHAILHIHGHWRSPSSIVLGRSSYGRVVADQRIQELLKGLWLNWHWLYVGCGDGLDDPNIGPLLEWSKNWGTSALPDFFLAREHKAKEIASRPGKPPNLISIGYPSHDELPVVLRSITPAARCWPFVRVDDEFPLFRVPGSNIPFPSRQEYLDGDVPTLAADAELQKRLQTHGWACVMDVASVGKTTLALRSATTVEQKPHPVFYLDLKEEILDDEDTSPVAALHRLARPGTLLILDNIHHQPELARQLWQQWNAKPPDSRGRTLLVATRIHQPVVVTPEQDLMFFERHPVNPAILVQPMPEDLGRLAKHIYRRVGGAKCPPMPEPPADALADWHRDYGAALNAFTFTVLNSLADFQNGKWALPLSRASAWVREKWLDKLDPPELENAICLAAFGAQELEMLVQDEALPHPGKTGKLLKLGLAAQTQRGQFKQYRQFSLRESGWGRLILIAVEPPRNNEQIRFDTVARHPVMAVTMSRRLKREGLSVERERLWKALAANQETLAAKLLDGSLVSVAHLLRESQESSQAALTSFLWDAIEKQSNKVAERAWETSLEHVAHFMEVARGHKRDTKPLWEAIESKPDMVAARAWETSLEHVARFMEVAKGHERDTKPLWDAIIGEPGQADQKAKLDRIENQAWQTSLEKTSSFLRVAWQQGRDTKLLWAALENDPDRLSQKGKDAALEELVGFAHYAPISLLEIALRGIKPEHWNSIPATEGMVGATWLAWECSNAKRPDLASVLITLLLRRANWRDFPSQSGGFAQVAWLLANVPSSATELIEPFLTAVRTEKWLQIAYAATSCAQLATGLRQLALNQSVERCCQFHHRGLGGRLNKELSRFETAAPSDQSQTIQLLGCAGLCGWAVSFRSLSNTSCESISQLPLGVLPHRPEVAKLEHAQFQLWLGLRAYVSITKSRLSLTCNVIEETLKLWRASLGETASAPMSSAHRVNQSMVTWLEKCLCAKPTALLPSTEPLWTLVGFPARLDLPKQSEKYTAGD